MKEIITIQVSQYLTNELAFKIAKAAWHSDAPAWVNRVRQAVFDDKLLNDRFEVIATNAEQAVIGRIHCIQNEEDRTLWYYGDLFVTPPYRRMGVATRMIKAAIDHLSDRNVKRLRCYVDPQNIASLSLQRSLWFREKPFEPFNDLTNDGEIMFEYALPNRLSVIPATEEEAYFVRVLFVRNKKHWKCENISLAEWRELLAADDPNVKHFLICKGAMPIAYMKLVGSQIDETAWVDMLFVAENYHRQGIGRYALSYAEEYARANAFSKLCIQVDCDNLPADRLCRKRGYVRVDHPDAQKLTYSKQLK